jgi:hypothetical protein
MPYHVDITVVTAVWSLATRSSTVPRGDAYTCSSRSPHTKIPSLLDLATEGILDFQIHLPGYFAFNHCLPSFQQCAGAPCCLTAEDTAPCRFGRTVFMKTRRRCAGNVSVNRQETHESVPDYSSLNADVEEDLTPTFVSRGHGPWATCIHVNHSCVTRHCSSRRHRVAPSWSGKYPRAAVPARCSVGRSQLNPAVHSSSWVHLTTRRYALLSQITLMGSMSMHLFATCTWRVTILSSF